MNKIFKILCLVALCIPSTVKATETNELSYQIKISQPESKTAYSLTPTEVLIGSNNGTYPQIVITGKLIVASTKAASLAKVKFAQEVLSAKNEFNQSIVLRLRGIIGGKTLGNQYVSPEFNAMNETDFTIEGFIDENSYRQGLLPGGYTFSDEQLLMVDFIN